MLVNTIQQFCNDYQWHDNAKDGVSMNERTFISFVKDLIREYGQNIGGSVYVTLNDIPPRMQQEYLKQWFFFEGYIEAYQDIFNNPEKIQQAIIEESKELEFWLTQYIKNVEEEYFSEYVYKNNLTIKHHTDNGEPFIVRI